VPTAAARTGEWKGSRCAAEISHELTPFHRCLPFRCRDWLYIGASAPESAMAASSARLRDASLAPRDESYTLSRCSEREGHDEQGRQEKSVLTKQHRGDFQFAICNIAILTGAAGFR
jgi:hypothetical protein